MREKSTSGSWHVAGVVGMMLVGTQVVGGSGRGVVCNFYVSYVLVNLLFLREENDSRMWEGDYDCVASVVGRLSCRQVCHM